jgi:hypothetical protein
MRQRTSVLSVDIGGRSGMNAGDAQAAPEYE